jgi:hypothetical protein
MSLIQSTCPNCCCVLEREIERLRAELDNLSGAALAAKNPPARLWNRAEKAFVDCATGSGKCTKENGDG